MSLGAGRRSKIFRKARPPIGSRPGTLAAPPDSPPPQIRVFAYGPDGVEEHAIADVEELRQWIEPGRTAWIDVRGLGDEALLRRVGEIFSLHPLALADAVNVPQRAKSEPYPDHQLVIARMPMVDVDGGIDIPQVAIFIGRRHLLSFQERSFGFFDPVRARLREGIGPIRHAGPDYLAYALIDTLVDGYYPIVESLTHELEELEDEAVGHSPGPEVLERIHVNRRRLVALRRVGRPQRDAVHELATCQSSFVSEEVQTYLRDTHDHIRQVIELVDSSHEMSVGLMEIYLSNVGQRTNEIMKVLTLMASIFIPLSFVAGVYGMNFDHMPELHRSWGYPAALGLMLTIAGSLLLYFRRRGWIGRGRGPRRR
jgi:magnesium transporter